VSGQTIADEAIADAWHTEPDAWDTEADDDPEPEVRDEHPVLGFPCCHVTIHILVENDAAEVTGQPPNLDARGAVPAQLSGSGKKDRSDAAIDSYERDMLAYAYRNDRPFRTLRLGKARHMTVTFPSLLKFVSEDIEVHLRASGTSDDRGRQVNLAVSTCITWFEENKRGVLHITFSPGPKDEPGPKVEPGQKVELNEYDLLKFVKLWEGGEFITQPIAFLRADGKELGEPWPQEIQDPNDARIARWTFDLLTALTSWASRGTGTRLTLVSNTQSGSSDPDSSAPGFFCVGTLDLLEEKESLRELLKSVSELLARENDYAEVADLTADDEEPADNEKPADDEKPADNEKSADDEKSAELRERSERLLDEWQQLVAIGGLIQGLLDFEEIGVDELRDVYATVMPPDEQATQSLAGADSLTAIHKGTLLSVAPNTERAQNWKTSVNPYLAIAHSVALYNEERMFRAKRSAWNAVRAPGDAADTSRAAADGGRTAADGGNASFDLSIAEARQWLRKADEQLEQFVQNVFVYPSERRIYEICHKTRALMSLRDDAKEQLELSRSLVEFREKKHGAVFAIIALLLGLIASVEGYFVKTTVWVAEPVLALLAVGLFPLMVYAAFYFWRRHH
jgi:hypothetical protein